MGRMYRVLEKLIGLKIFFVWIDKNVKIFIYFMRESGIFSKLFEKILLEEEIN